MESQANILLTLATALEMDPLGCFTGMTGAVISVLFINGNNYTWQQKLAIILAGMFFGGYAVKAIEKVPYLDRILALLSNAFAGFIVPDIMTTIKTDAPTFTRTIVGVAMNMLQRILGVSKKTKDE